MKLGNAYKISLITSFLIIVFGCFLSFAFLKPIEVDVVENRALNTCPSLNIDHLDAFPVEYDEYVNDQFPFRKGIISEYNHLMLKYFHRSPVPDKVLIGHEGWLFLSGRNMDTYLGKNLFSKKELILIEKELEYRATYCTDRGIKFYFVIIPQKHTIYQEYLPNYLINITGQTIRTQLKAQLSDNERINLIDLTEELLNKKDKDFLFYKTDNHWNDLGAFYASNYILKRIKKDFPEIKEIKIEDYNLSHKLKAIGSLSKMISSKEYFKDEKIIFNIKVPTNAKDGEKSNYEISKGFPYPRLYEVVTVNKDAPPVKMLMIRESFANSQTQFLQIPFRKAIYIWDSWHFGRNEEIIESEKPDIVILQIYEPLLTNLIKDKSSNSL